MVVFIKNVGNFKWCSCFQGWSFLEFKIICVCQKLLIISKNSLKSVKLFATFEVLPSYASP